MIRSRLIAIGLLASSQGAYSQILPTDAGAQLQQIPPAPKPSKRDPDFSVAPRAVAPESAPAGASIAVRSLRVTGASLFADDALIAASGFTPGKALTLAELRGLAARITAFYNARGYFLAQAYLPPQDISGGAVTIAVIEGRYGKVSVDNHSALSRRAAAGMLDGLDSGEVVTSRALERRLLLLSDLPGVEVSSVLSPGTAVGTSDLVVRLNPGPRVNGSVEADNAGNRYTGAYRLGGSVNLNNPAGLGDVFSVRALASAAGLAYGRAAYQLPLGDATIGAAYSYIRYELGREFKSLRAEGDADIFSLFASYPLVRSRRANLHAVGGLDAKRFEDRVRLTAAESRRSSRVLNIGLSGNSQDSLGGGGSNVYSAIFTTGALDIRTPLDRATDALTARSDGGFSKAQLSVARLQAISGPFSLYGAVRGQLAFDNLDSSEKMELGGAYGVRAYPEGEAYGDQGYLATLEGRLALGGSHEGLPGRFQIIGFIDVGAVDYAKTPWFAGSNTAHRSGYGAGLSWSGPEDILISASYARKLGDAAVTSGPDRSGRAWFQIVKLF